MLFSSGYTYPEEQFGTDVWERPRSMWGEPDFEEPLDYDRYADELDTCTDECEEFK